MINLKNLRENPSLFKKKYKELEKIAIELNLDILTEVSHPKEVKRAIQLGSKLIGINNPNNITCVFKNM